MMGVQYFINQILKGLLIFNYSRLRIYIQLDVMTRKLALELSLFNDLDRYNKKLLNKAEKPYSSRSLTIRKILYVIVKAYESIKNYRLSKGASLCFLVMASNRLAFSEHKSIRQQLSIMLKGKEGCATVNEELINNITTPEFIIIIDPELISRVWDNKPLQKKLVQEKIIIADSIFLLLTSLSRPIDMLNNICKVFFLKKKTIALKDINASTQISNKQSIVATIYTLGLYRLLNSFSQPNNIYSAFFLTSNSFLVEVARSYFINDSACVRIVEIMHGIQCIEDEYYFASLNQHFNTQKVKFVFLLPGLKQFGSFHSENVLNTYIDTNLNLKFSKFGDDKELFFQDSKKKILGEKQNEINSNVILGFIGNNSADKFYFQSITFQIELAMIKMICEIQDKINSESYEIIYSRHPAVTLSDSDYEKYFKPLNIKVIDNLLSLISCSDVIVSLYSGGMFQASYSNVPVYTPLRLNNNMYPNSHFEKLYFPVDGLSIKDSLDEFLKKQSNFRNVDRNMRACERINKLINF